MASINIKFPLEDDNEKNGLFELNDVTKDALTSNLVLLLLTNKGERYYQPDYGTNLLRYVFEPKDGFTIADIEEEVRSTVKSFIPQLTIKTIDFNQDENDLGDGIGKNELNIIVRFVFQEDTFSEEGELTLTL